MTPTQPQHVWVKAQTTLQRKVSDLIDATLEFINKKLLELTQDIKKRATDSVDFEMQNMPLFVKQKLQRTKSITATKAEQLQKRKEIKTA